MSYPETQAHLGAGTLLRPLPHGSDQSVPPLRAALADLLGSSPTRAAVKQVVDVFLRGAEAYLRRRMAPQGGRIDRFGLSFRDLAIDCVAGLLARDEQGGFPNLERYFPDGWMDLDEAGILHRIRLLTCRAVDDGLYRRYAEHDPQLARLIRGLQRGCAVRGDVSVDRRLGTLHLTVLGPCRSSCLPISRDRLEAYMMAHIRTTDRAADYLGHFVDLIGLQEDVLPTYPLVGVALAVRGALSRLHEPAFQTDTRVAVDDREEEDLIRSTVQEIAVECRPKYVGKGKVDGIVYDAYCAAVGDVLIASYRHSAAATTLGDCLRDYLPDLSRGAYRARHRGRCEYLLRLVKERLKNRLRNLRTFSAESFDGNEREG